MKDKKTDELFDALTRFINDQISNSLFIKKTDIEAIADRIGMPTDSQPDLIQGYTAEQWQEIIDGGYLCEFRNSTEDGWFIDTLRTVHHEHKMFESGNYSDWKYCRPAQIKGVMRPIWVEPVDENGRFIFFDENGDYTGKSNDFTNPSWEEIRPDLVSSITKYIEL
jgi:hypothetical protein